jgi:ABC-type amino acid transport substrate-binding protein
VKNKSWPEILKMAQHGELDMISDINKTPEREQYLSFTEPYISNPAIIIDNDNGLSVPWNTLPESGWPWKNLLHTRIADTRSSD